MKKNDQQEKRWQNPERGYDFLPRGFLSLISSFSITFFSPPFVLFVKLILLHSKQGQSFHFYSLSFWNKQDICFTFMDHGVRDHSFLFCWVSRAWEEGVSKLWALNSPDSSLTWETATRCPPLIHNQASNTPLPKWFNCPICQGCCSPQNKRHDNDDFPSPARHAAFHSWSKVSELLQFFHWWISHLLLSVILFRFGHSFGLSMRRDILRKIV